MEKLQYAKQVCLVPSHLVRLFRQPKFFLAMVISLPSGVMGAAIKYLHLDAPGGILHGVINDNAVYSGLTMLIVFLLQFRVSAAYSKFLQGTELVYNIFGDLLDSASSLIAFCKGAKASTQAVDDFLHLLVRLFSLLNALVFAELQHDPTVDELPLAYEYDIIDIQGINEKSLNSLADAEVKVEMVLQWIQQSIVTAHQEDVFGVPPPVLSRAFQDLGSAMVNFHKALKVMEVPFPFPYKVALQLLLITQFCITPIVTAQWTDNAIWTGGFCVIATFAPWFFIGLAMELDHPYGRAVNSLDLGSLQQHLNQRLLTCLLTFKDDSIGLSENAIRDVDELLSPSATNLSSIGSMKSSASWQQEVHKRRFPSRSLTGDMSRSSIATPSSGQHQELTKNNGSYSSEPSQEELAPSMKEQALLLKPSAEVPEIPETLRIGSAMDL